jgi:hypothetical protein
MDYLMTKGGSPRRCSPPRASARPSSIADESTEEGKEKNRRVEFNITEQDVTEKKVEIDPKSGEKKVLEEKVNTVKTTADPARSGAHPHPRHAGSSTMLSNILKSLACISIIAASVLPGCTCVARDAETYRADTRTLLETRNRAIKDCYDVALDDRPQARRQVVVKFKVEKKTGKILDTAVDGERTKAPEALSKCIVEAVDGLTLDPVDQREGQATFSWTFKANPPKAHDAA